MAETLNLTLLVDNESNRVVFAESDHQFIDILFSFLILPMGTIVRLLNKSSSLGSFDRLYRNVEDLDPQFFQSDFCKSMLLRPRSAYGLECEGLAINIDDSDHRGYYKCSKCKRCASWALGVRCKCGGFIDAPIMVVRLRKGDEKDGVFVKGERRFMVSDDLKVRPVSMGETLGLLSKLGIEDGSVLERRVVHLGKDEILKLLKRSLVSKTPLTDTFMPEQDIINVEDKSVVTDINEARVKQRSTSPDSKKINVKLYLSTYSNKVVCAEAGEDLVDLLFTFLTFPLGSVIRLMKNNSSVGCIDNLYQSVQLLSSDFGHLNSEECENKLWSPLLPPYFGSCHQLLNIGDMPPQKILASACMLCKGTGFAGRCFHGIYHQVYDEVNPKQQNFTSGTGDGYARKIVKFMVTDEMQVIPLSPISGVHIIKKLMVPLSSLEEAQVSLGEAEALNLLKACLFSQTVLNDVFSPYLLTLLHQNWCGQLPKNCKGGLD